MRSSTVLSPPLQLMPLLEVINFFHHSPWFCTLLPNSDYMVKNPFSLSVFYFKLLGCILQVSQKILTPVDNLQHLLNLPNLTRLDLLHSIYSATKETTITGFYQKEKSKSVHDLDSLLAITNEDHC